MEPVLLLGLILGKKSAGAKWRFQRAGYQGTTVPVLVPVEQAFRLY
jgi:hypothetical protein